MIFCHCFNCNFFKMSGTHKFGHVFVFNELLVHVFSVVASSFLFHTYLPFIHLLVICTLFVYFKILFYSVYNRCCKYFPRLFLYILDLTYSIFEFRSLNVICTYALNVKESTGYIYSIVVQNTNSGANF